MYICFLCHLAFSFSLFVGNIFWIWGKRTPPGGATFLIPQGAFNRWLVRIPCTRVNANLEKLAFVVPSRVAVDVNNCLVYNKLHVRPFTRAKAILIQPSNQRTMPIPPT